MRWVYLSITSFLYYGLIGWESCIILFIVGFSSYCTGIALEKYRKNGRTFIYLGILFLTGVLLLARYQIFFIDNISQLFKLNISALELGYWQNKLSFFLTIGIGFYTLQAMGYLFDIYNGRITATKDIFLHFAFLSFFPKLLAGPLERNKTFRNQLEQIVSTTEAERWQGFKNIVFGLFLKYLIADNLAPYVNSAFQDLVLNQSTLFWWVTITTFAIQIYCDFNGYTHIVMGLAQLMGYKLSENFNLPYLSTSPSEFWTRWHITLSTWLREYIFFPLSRSKYLKGKYYINTWITMLLSGIWHGAGWTFIVWGSLHAFFISVDQLTHWSTYLKKFTFGKFICIFLMWLQLDISWVFFRANSINQALDILRIMFSFNFNNFMGVSPISFVFITAAVLMDTFMSLSKKRPVIVQPLHQRVLEVVVFSILLVVSIYFRGVGSRFIYFQF